MPVQSYVKRIAEEAQKVNLVFVHAGHLFAPERIIVELTEELGRDGKRVVNVDLDEVGGADPRSDLVIGGFTKIVKGTRQARQQSLANARASLMSQLEAGDRKRVVMISDVPKSILLTNPGSQLVQDARPLHLRPLDREESNRALEGSALTDEQVRQVFEWSGGLPRLIDALVTALSDDGGETIERSRTIFAESFRISLGELDIFSLATLEDWMVGTDDLERPLDVDDPLLQEALIGSGLLTVPPDDVGLRFTVPRAERIWREAFQDALIGQIREDESVGELSLLLWRLERRVRAILRTAAIGRHGDDWRTAMLGGASTAPELAQDLVDRYRREVMVQVDDVEEVPNPCDWLTLDEALRLLEARTAEAVIPLTPAFCRRLKEEVVPIRNRIAHSRLPKKRDREKVKGWLTRLI